MCIRLILEIELAQFHHNVSYKKISHTFPSEKTILNITELFLRYEVLTGTVIRGTNIVRRNFRYFNEY